MTSGKKRQLVKKPVQTATGPWVLTYAVAISPDSSKVLRTQSDFATNARTLTILDSSSGKLLLTIPVDTKPGELPFPFRSWFSPDGRFVAMCSGFAPLVSLVRVWDAATGQLILTRPASDAVFTSYESLVLDDIREEVPTEHNLKTGVDDEHFADIPKASQLAFSQLEEQSLNKTRDDPPGVDHQ